MSMRGHFSTVRLLPFLSLALHANERADYSNVFSLLTRMRQMACHPDLVLRSRNNAGMYIPGADDEAAVCRLCHDTAEDAIAAKCKHVFDRECIRQYLSTADDAQPDCPV